MKSLAAIIAAVALIGISMIGAADEARPLLAGAAKSNITPALGVSMPGGMSDRKATHVHDELYARCLVLANGETTLALAICDAVALSGETIARAKELIQQRTGIPPERVLVAATHTHEGAATVGAFQSDPDAAYLDFMVARIADGVRRAANNLRPARAGWGVGRVEGAVFNRRYFMKPGTMPPNPWGRTDEQVKMNPGVGNADVTKPAGPVDPGLPILAIQGADGEPIAVLANYALHYVGGERGGDISADYFGMFAEAVEREWAPRDPAKPPVVAMMTNGCSGDINNVDVLGGAREQRQPYEQMRKVAGMAAAETLRVLKDMQYQERVALDSRFKNLDLAIRKPSPQDVEEAKAVLAKAKSPLQGLNEIYARETVLLAERPDRVQVPVQAVRIGEAGLVVFPVEAFVELGLEVKEKSPFAMTMIVDLANSYCGYVPTVKGHKQGGYETWRARSSCLEREAAPKLVAKGLEFLKEMRGN